jgi:CRISPR/Cas system CSM-associated protein Csm3 (group 7 of RAMP superfamily)
MADQQPQTSDADVKPTESRKWHPDSSRQIHKRFVITGKLVLDTPASFSNGETTGTEIIILEDALEGKPLLPGASLAGALRHYLLTREQGYRTSDTSKKRNKTLATLLFGEALDDGTERMESRVIVNDALGEGKLTRREGVKIAGDTRTADEGMLFSAQVWAAGTIFDLRFELILYENDDNHADYLIGAFAAALQALGTGKIPLGGRKQRGYGRLHVDDWRVCFYDMTNPVALSAWLCNELYSDDGQDFFALAETLTDKRQYVRIEATLQLCDSILIRASSDFADNEHLTSDNKPVLSGTSLAGALRARALKIAKTVNRNYADTIVDDLFGKHGAADNEKAPMSASRIRVEEHRIEGGVFNYIQNRVKIDRFTGGAFETALFTERPLFADGDTRVHVNLELCYPDDGEKHALLDAQTGLLLLVLKDLWTEDLALGGEASIGRGRLKGQAATLQFKFADNDEPIIIDLNEQGLSQTQHLDAMQTYVDTLWNYPET